MKAVLMDREETLIVDPPFDRVDVPEKVRLLPDTCAALGLLAKHGYGIIIITNQTNIAQGRLSEQGFWPTVGGHAVQTELDEIIDGKFTPFDVW